MPTSRSLANCSRRSPTGARPSDDAGDQGAAYPTPKGLIEVDPAGEQPKVRPLAEIPRMRPTPLSRCGVFLSARKKRACRLRLVRLYTAGFEPELAWMIATSIASPKWEFPLLL